MEKDFDTTKIVLVSFVVSLFVIVCFGFHAHTQQFDYFKSVAAKEEVKKESPLALRELLAECKVVEHEQDLFIKRLESLNKAK